MWKSYLFFILLLLPDICRGDDWEKHLYRAEHGKLPGISRKKDSSKARSFRGFGRYERQFRDLFRFVALDGRAEKFQELMEVNTARDQECLACRPLFKSLASTSKSALVRAKSAAGDSGANGFARQREPRLEVLSSLLLVFREIKSDDEIKELSLPAIRRLIRVLREEKSFSAAEREYFGYLADAIDRIFFEQSGGAANGNKKKDAPAQWHQQEGVIDDFFDG